jgi:hypothetical protein
MIFELSTSNFKTMSGNVMMYLVMFLLVGGLTLLFFWWRNSAEELGSKITGIWENADNTIRVLIYEIDSIFQGEVVWTNVQNQRVLGARILHSIELKNFKLGKGIYNCPFTHQQYQFQLKLVKNELLSLHLHTREGIPVLKEQWRLIK